MAPRCGALPFLRSFVRAHWTAKAAAALKGLAPAPEVAELALAGWARTEASSFFQVHRMRRAGRPSVGRCLRFCNPGRSNGLGIRRSCLPGQDRAGRATPIRSVDQEFRVSVLISG